MLCYLIIPDFSVESVSSIFLLVMVAALLAYAFKVCLLLYERLCFPFLLVYLVIFAG